MPESELIIPREKLESIYENLDGARLIQVLGHPSMGKTTSLRFMPPEHTYVINVVGKEFPFPNAAKYKRDTFKGKAHENAGNLVMTTSYLDVITIMKNISKTRPEIDYLIIDDFTYLMTQEFADTVSQRNYDKFTDMAVHVWTIMRTCKDLRSTLKVILMGHVEMADNVMLMQTVGKMTREKFRPEGLTTMCFVPGVERLSEEGDARYFFLTQSDGVTPARSPMGMFPYRIPNDMFMAMQRMDEYYSGTTLEDSKLDMELKVTSARKTSIRR